MGKTMAGAVWLNAERVSAYDFWQYWRNTEDADVGRFLKLFTELPLSEIARLVAAFGLEIGHKRWTGKLRKALYFTISCISCGLSQSRIS